MSAPPVRDVTGLYRRFSDTARAHPDLVALEAGDAAPTYRELERRAADVAADVLHATGGAPPARIGLLAPRGIPAFAAYLAVQRLGRTVVPLDPSAPPQRLRRIVAAGGIGLLLSDAADATAAVPALDVTRPSGRGAELPEPVRTGPDDVAYVLFTSGSTGVPKGVPVTHANLSAHLDHVIDRYRAGPGARMSQNFELTFDLSVFDMFVAWGSGATLVLTPPQDLLSPVRHVVRGRLTHWFSVPSAVSFAQRMRALRPDAMPDLRWSLFCGEPLTLEQAAAWATAAPACVLENLYGPTELTISCTQYRLPADRGRWPRTANGTVPIGDAYPGVEHRVVDADGAPADDGELVVRGPQRFGGYLDPADDRGRFVALDDGRGRDPGRGRPGGHDGAPARGHDGGPVPRELWYRTGDRVRVEHGTLVHRGRLDHQVKIRGYRVELGEIEAVLRSVPGVVDAVVVANTGPAGEAVLDAACTGTADPDVVVATLGERLPSYMVPRRVERLDDVPRTSSGKVDRRAIAARLADPAPPRAPAPPPGPAQSAAPGPARPHDRPPGPEEGGTPPRNGPIRRS